MALICAELLFVELDFADPQKLVPQKFFKISYPQTLVPKSFSKTYVFKTQHASKIGKALDAGKLPENIEIPLRLSGLKALHAS